MSHQITLKPRAEFLRPLLAEWIDLYQEASQNFPQDSDAYFLEQTLNALIVAAGWKLGVPGILEARVRRQDGPGTRGGRADIFLKFADEITAIETKIHWFDDTGAFEKVLGMFLEAQTQASSIVSDLVPNRLGLCYGILERADVPAPQLLEDAVLRAQAEDPDILVRSDTTQTNENAKYTGYLVLGRFVGQRTAA